MATETIVRLVDDMDGSEADESVIFGLDGQTYEIDLSSKHASELRDALAKYVGHARRVVGRREASAPKKISSSSDLPLAEIREWARANGYEVSDRGRIKADIVKAWQDGRPAPVEEPEEDQHEPAEMPVVDTSDQAILAWHQTKGYQVPTSGVVNGLMRHRYGKAHGLD